MQQAELGELAQKEKLSEAALGQHVAATLVSEWEAELARMHATGLPPHSRLEPLRSDVLQYIDGQRLGLELVAEGLQTHQKDKIERGTQLLKRAPERRNEIQTLSRELY
jgi:hypothetical protein